MLRGTITGEVPDVSSNPEPVLFTISPSPILGKLYGFVYPNLLKIYGATYSSGTLTISLENTCYVGGEHVIYPVEVDGHHLGIVLPRNYVSSNWLSKDVVVYNFDNGSFSNILTEAIAGSNVIHVEIR